MSTNREFTFQTNMDFFYPFPPDFNAIFLVVLLSQYDLTLKMLYISVQRPRHKTNLFSKAKMDVSE